MMLEAQARDALRRGDLPGAASLAKALAQDDPDNPLGFFLLGMAAAEAGQVAQAVPLIEAAVARGPDPEHLAQLARLLVLLRREGEAGAAARAALALSPGDALTLDTLGCVLTRLGDHEGAMAPFSAAVAAQPDNPDFRYNLAAACGFTARTDQAAAHYEAILTADPVDGRAHYALAILTRQSPLANHVARLEAALAKATDPDDALRIRYALAKELEDIGDAAGSYRHLSTANAAQKRALNYDFGQDRAIFDAIEAAFVRDRRDCGPGSASEAPIFIVGMPRTGTTLVDRILSSHRDVEAAGELQAMPLAIKQLSATPSRRVIDPQTVAASAGLDPDEIAGTYLARAAHHRRTGKPRFTDKLPANFLYIGHILRAFPKARIVCLRRNPLDTIWSNYKNLFASQSAYYAYSYDLIDTARYFVRFDRLIAHWDEVWPGRVLQLSYEALVNDFDSQVRQLLEYCGLGWDDACLKFHENGAAVATPSAAQVRRPINADGMGKWRAHATALEPARAWLESHGIRTD